MNAIMNHTVADERWMSMALNLAQRGRYTTMPNPRVGCVIVRDGVVVGSGWHQFRGDNHAEHIALAAAGTNARDATVYVNLEPCAHIGHTGSCADALIAASVSRVVIGHADPNPLVNGQGIARLRDAGINVQADVMHDAAIDLNQGFISRMQSARPFVLLKLAMSLDGRIASADNTMQWISGTAARTEVQDLRAESCAILTGIGTIMADNPRLTVRSDQWQPRYPFELSSPLPQPLIVVADSHNQLATDAKVRALGKKLLVASLKPVNEDCDNYWQAPALDDKVDLTALLTYLATTHECNQVLAECGGRLAHALLAAHLVDELRLYIAPKLLGATATPLLGLDFIGAGLGLTLDIQECRRVGDDYCLHIVPQYN